MFIQILNVYIYGQQKDQVQDKELRHNIKLGREVRLLDIDTWLAHRSGIEYTGCLSEYD